MNTAIVAVDWGLCDDRVRALETRLHDVLSLEENSSNSARLSMLMFSFARLTRHLLNEELTMYLGFVERRHSSGKFPLEMTGAFEKLDAKGNTLMSLDPGTSFLYMLIAAATTDGVAVTADNEVAAVGWLAALGCRVEEIEKAIASHYPEF